MLHPEAPERGFMPGDSVEYDFWLMLRSCDRLWLYSAPDGAIVVLEQDAIPAQTEWLTRSRDPENCVHLVGEKES